MERITLPDGRQLLRWTEATLVELLFDDKERLVEVKISEGWQQDTFGINRD
jgi:hypothetical protein